MDSIAISSPVGLVHRRPERDDDRDFRFRLFCQSRPPEFVLLERQLGPAAMEQLMRFQFAAQTTSYCSEFPGARFDIIELEGSPIGRIVVDRSAKRVLIVDQAIVPELRQRGIGTAVMRGVMDDAAAAGLPVRLQVATSNDPSLSLYLRLGFKPIESTPMYLELEWRADAAENTGPC